MMLYTILNQIIIFSDHKFKVIIVGDAGVGKSCLMQRYAVSFIQTSCLNACNINYPTTLMQYVF